MSVSLLLLKFQRRKYTT